ncbi:MAG TPA: hypothetical protein VHZ55_32560 [Bryobacteraceae bacterium]|nr:hypothetical protein [Bryobacteraceae bacterium]
MSRKMIRRVWSPVSSGTAFVTVALAAWAISTPVNDWTITGPFGGTARSVAVDPQHPEVVLAGGMNSLLFRSHDAGQNWDMLYFPKRNLSEVTSILVDPTDSNHYFAGMISADGGGLFESHDEGHSWEVVKALSRFGVRAIAAAPSKPAELVAGTFQGVWLTENSGKDWKRISDRDNLEMQGVTVVAVDSKDPDTIYAGTSHLPWKTTDRGKTWESIHTGMIDDSDVFSIFVDPNNPASILASACSGIYSSDSKGEQWKKLMGIPNTSRRTHVVREDPANPDVIYAGTTTGLFKSTNRGAVWKSMSDTQANSIAFDPTHPGTMYMALEYEGIGKSEDGAQTIHLMNHGFVDRSISSVTASGDKLFAIETQEGETSGIFASTDHGASWTRSQDERGLGGVHLKAITGLPSQTNVLLAASPHHLYKTTDGLLWKPLLVKVIEPPPPAKPAAAPATTRRGTATHRTTSVRSRRPVKPMVKIRQVNLSEISGLYATKGPSGDIVYAATDLGLLKSTDGGERWTISTISGAPAIYALYSSPDGNGHLIARAAGALFVSKDFGEHWDDLHFPTAVSDINEVAIAPGTSSALLAATRVGLYSSKDEGATWFAGVGGIPASTVTSVLFTNANGNAWAVEYGRLYHTEDGGTWKEVPTSIPSLQIRQLWQPDVASGRLYGITSDLGILFRDSTNIR